MAEKWAGGKVERKGSPREMADLINYFEANSGKQIAPSLNLPPEPSKNLSLRRYGRVHADTVRRVVLWIASRNDVRYY